MKKAITSWQNVHKQYSEYVGENGSYFHEQVILPKLNEILEIDSHLKILDLGCGEGILSRSIKKYELYLGLDISKGLIEEAKKKNRNANAKFDVKDVSSELKIEQKNFTHCTIVLALQNIENQFNVIQNAYNHLINGGKFVIVINHPYYRIPKSTSWEIDAQTGYQYRKVLRYLSNHKVRIDMNPGERNSKNFTYSYHFSLTDYSLMLKKAGFCIEYIDEWISNKVSQGPKSQAENFARAEFPLFMCIVCKKS